MKITSIKIEKLFEIFDYDISFEADPNLLIITGPNGFGKTMILNVIYSLFNREFIFFHRIVFNTITVNLNEETSVIVTKKIDNDNLLSKLEIDFVQNEQKIGNIVFNVSSADIDAYLTEYNKYIQRVEPGKWREVFSNKTYTFSDLLSFYGLDYQQSRLTSTHLPTASDVNHILDSINVHIIKEQRLFRKEQNFGQNHDNENRSIMIETILSYSNILKKSFQELANQSYRIAQDLDASYPSRLISETKKITETDYNIRFKNLTEKQGKLRNYGLYESTQKVLDYSVDDAKALLVYLNDLDKKLGGFDELLKKLDLFTTILNERRFTFKSIYCTREEGFYFKTDRGTQLELNQLSSGEQHEVVLLYELIFNAEENTLVLIDEPELSLHVTWQKEFLNDLIKIIELQNIQVLIATHAPAIINGRWDLVYNLEKVEAE